MSCCKLTSVLSCFTIKPKLFFTCFGVLFPRALAILAHRLASIASCGYTCRSLSNFRYRMKLQYCLKSFLLDDDCLPVWAFLLITYLFFSCPRLIECYRLITSYQFSSDILRIVHIWSKSEENNDIRDMKS